MKAHLAAAAHASPAAFTEIRFEHRRGTTILQRGSEVVFTAAPERAAGVVRCHTPGYAWGVASFRTLDELRGALRTAQEGSLAATRSPTRPRCPPSPPARSISIVLRSAIPSRIALADKLELVDDCLARPARPRSAGGRRRGCSTRTL